jgi:hypothetical protein
MEFIPFEAGVKNLAAKRRKRRKKEEGGPALSPFFSPFPFSFLRLLRLFAANSWPLPADC